MFTKVADKSIQTELSEWLGRSLDTRELICAPAFLARIGSNVAGRIEPSHDDKLARQSA
jgi:hypothetical protein